MTGHDVDLATCYCTRCGASALDVVNRDLPCADDVSNVVAISHVVARRRLDRLLRPHPFDPPHVNCRCVLLPMNEKGEP